MLLGFLLLPGALMATDLVYNNSGTINNANIPQVDAITFINSGTWDINFSIYVYETANTLNYTNTGTMNSAPGWEFDLNPSSTGQRTNSANFFNDVSGTIQASDGFVNNPCNYCFLYSQLFADSGHEHCQQRRSCGNSQR